MYRNDYAHNDGIVFLFRVEIGVASFLQFSSRWPWIRRKGPRRKRISSGLFSFLKNHSSHKSMTYFMYTYPEWSNRKPNNKNCPQVTNIIVHYHDSHEIRNFMKFVFSFFCKDSSDRLQRAETIYWFWWKWIENVVDRFPLDTYTSTKTGKAASRNSSRQLGGYRTWTCTRVPCCKVISNDCFFGSASLSRRCRIDEFPILNSSCSNILVLIECTPAKLRNAKAKQLKQLKCWTKHRRREKKKKSNEIEKQYGFSIELCAQTHTQPMYDGKYKLIQCNWSNFGI